MYQAARYRLREMWTRYVRLRLVSSEAVTLRER